MAAVDKPKLHLWENGVMRITRHPQAFGQGLWCFGHTLWIGKQPRAFMVLKATLPLQLQGSYKAAAAADAGSSFMVLTTLLLMAHHAFACWHGDFRLKRQYGPVRALLVSTLLPLISFKGCVGARLRIVPYLLQCFVSPDSSSIVVDGARHVFSRLASIVRGSFWLISCASIKGDICLIANFCPAASFPTICYPRLWLSPTPASKIPHFFGSEG